LIHRCAFFCFCLAASPGGGAAGEPLPAGGPSAGAVKSIAASDTTATASAGRTAPRWPEWLVMAVAILRGEGMEEGKGWWRPSISLHGWGWLRDRLDTNRDEKISLGEGLALGEGFDRLDRNEDGAITREDFEDPEPPEPSAIVRGLFRILDHDTNDRVSWDELSWFFQKADRRKRGFITRRDLTSSLSDLVFREDEASGGDPRGKRAGDPEPPRWQLLRLLLSGELGSLGEGPALGSEAPGFSLPSLKGGGQSSSSAVSLAASRGKRPVVLIFGSFT